MLPGESSIENRDSSPGSDSNPQSHASNAVWISLHWIISTLRKVGERLAADRLDMARADASRL